VIALGFWAVAAAIGLAAPMPAPTAKVQGGGAPPLPAEWSGDAPGQVIVVAGDLMLIRGQSVRLADVAAPTPAQRCDTGRGFVACGATATQALRDLIGASPVLCRILGPEPMRWVRARAVWLGLCRAGGADLGLSLVEAGYAVAAPASGYASDAVSACVGRRGVWAWSLESPWTFTARREGADVRPLFIGAGSGTPCLRALEAPRPGVGH
jgi:endonuclease YncB( thermonuclease family)